MTTRATVAVLRTQPEKVLPDYQRLFELAGGTRPNTTTILKDNISWHFPMPSANTTPWQLEGTILILRRAGFTDLVCVENQTEDWRANTPWGQLFQRYQREGYLANGEGLGRRPRPRWED